MNSITNALHEAEENAQTFKAKAAAADAEYQRWSRIVESLREAAKLHDASVNDLKPARPGRKPGVKISWEDSIKEILTQDGPLPPSHLYRKLKERHGRPGYDAVAKLKSTGQIVLWGAQNNLLKWNDQAAA